MKWPILLALAVARPTNALIRFHCSQLVTERLDPLVTPGLNPSPHVHQIVGGNSFNVTMPLGKDMSGESTCTTCQFPEDTSNYWTATIYFKAANETYKRVQNIGNNQFRDSNGGMTVYYMTDAIYDTNQASKVTTFKPGFRMFIGDINARTLAEASRFRYLTYTCLDTFVTRSPETIAFPDRRCKEGIMTTLRFPTCWDGINLDSPDHISHMSYPETGTFESGGPCPSTHPVRTPQVMFEVVWNTTEFNDLEWPKDGSQPFVWSFGDSTGYGNHADYVFGWKDDALQRIMDTPHCHFATNCSVESKSPLQSVADMNKCTQKVVVDENIDGWLTELPGGHQSW